jgi:TBC1 domain family member 5
VALQLLLKYPPPDAIHGPHTFIDDALYLRDHLDTKGGSALILKYTGRQPNPIVVTSRPSTPKKPTNNHGLKMPLSPSHFPSRFMQQQGGVEALFQGAAKGLLERSEKLGVNQAVRDALVEIRRNVHDAKTSMKASRDLFAESGPNSPAARAVAAMDRRNKQLALLLDESVTSLKALARSENYDDKEYVEALEVATAKIQFVKVYLEDSTMVLPDDEQSKPGSAIMSPTEPELEVPSDAVAAMVISTPEIGSFESPNPEEPSAPTAQVPASAVTPSEPTAEHTGPAPMDTDDPLPAPEAGIPSIPEETETTTITTDPLAEPTGPLQRPQPPIPTRSTLAQSSFAWMLEPDQSGDPSSGLESKQAAKLTKIPPLQNHKKPSSNANRERTAFLFGEVTPGEDGQAMLPENIFGLQPMGKNKEKRTKLWDD